MARHPRHCLTAIAAAVLALSACGGATGHFDTSGLYRDRPVHELILEVQPSIEFQAHIFGVPAGRLRIRLTSPTGATSAVGFSSDNGPHVTLIAPPRRENENVATVNLFPGRYVIGAVIAGHRAAGQEATLIVEAPK